MVTPKRPSLRYPTPRRGPASAEVWLAGNAAFRDRECFGAARIGRSHFLSLSPAQARQVGRIGGLRRAALNDSVELARQGQAGLRRRLLAEVDPDGSLDAAERERRVQRALRAHMLTLQLRSAKALRQRRRLSKAAK
jgi:hypothetical protein